MPLSLLSSFFILVTFKVVVPLLLKDSNKLFKETFLSKFSLLLFELDSLEGDSILFLSRLYFSIRTWAGVLPSLNFDLVLEAASSSFLFCKLVVLPFVGDAYFLVGDSPCFLLLEVEVPCLVGDTAFLIQPSDLIPRSFCCSNFFLALASCLIFSNLF
uniref:Secreted protein n=1 Tax=Panstrongylus lignarius TaxID=156445 RepID=A0A224XYU8_9HEMI